ncbi:COQ9 family protein [Tranquillimonas alkanivorans]|uniref:Ubiquinone biosynthesis protein COQ9 n=1 Tax=Tranquillimonas alkanivorans TaxID=441119 RepID=A0A1I5KSG0_9RHOB|nr:COQ9 family protein [Tranquillimonas alkanivorans]SFO87937.1 ubiquinone biosynthesis protein COQ9 [Tranquillimonas alkanivorans]
MIDPNDPRDAILDAALVHVPFDGWSEATLRAAAKDAGIELAEAHALFPRGAVDLALAFHRRGDEAMTKRLKSEPLDDLRFRDKVARAVRTRLEVIEDREAVRRGATLFALPQHSADGAKALWETADAIWTALGDPSDDINWYTKRATLSGVYGATVLYWLGDETPEHHETWEFLDRRIEDVMRIEKAKKTVNENRLLRTLFAGPNWALSKVRAPSRMPRMDLPGRWAGPSE